MFHRSATSLLLVQFSCEMQSTLYIIWIFPPWRQCMASCNSGHLLQPHLALHPKSNCISCILVETRATETTKSRQKCICSITVQLLSSPESMRYFHGIRDADFFVFFLCHPQCRSLFYVPWWLEPTVATFHWVRRTKANGRKKDHSSSFSELHDLEAINSTLLTSAGQNLDRRLHWKTVASQLEGGRIKLGINCSLS